MSGVANNEAISRLNGEYGGTAYTHPTTHKMGLATGDPAQADAPANEASGGSYARQAATFGAAGAATGGGGQISNNASITFAGMAAGTLTHGFVTREDTGNQQISFALTPAVPVLAGQSIVFAAGAVTIVHT